MQNLLQKFIIQIKEKKPQIIALGLITIVWIILQAVQLELQNNFKTNEIQSILISNWNKTPIIEFNISKQCQDTWISVNFEVPSQNAKCLCQEGIYDRQCSQDQEKMQGCIQIKEFIVQNISYWPFYKRISILVPYQLCYQQSNLKTYYNQLKENKCFNDTQPSPQQPISNISIIRNYYVNEQIILQDSIQIDRNLNDPIIDIYIKNQYELEIYRKGRQINQINQTNSVEQLQSFTVWNANNISIDDDTQYHDDIYFNHSYDLITERYIKLNDKCDCSNQAQFQFLFARINTMTELIELEDWIPRFSYIQTSLILIFIFIIMLAVGYDQMRLLLITFLFLPVVIIQLINYLSYLESSIKFIKCFDSKFMDYSFSQHLLGIQITLIIILSSLSIWGIQWRNRRQVYADPSANDHQDEKHIPEKKQNNNSDENNRPHGDNNPDQDNHPITQNQLDQESSYIEETSMQSKDLCQKSFEVEKNSND